MYYVAWLLLMLSLARIASSPLSAQEPAAGIDIADRAPRFMMASAESAAPAVVDAGSVAVLRRRISLDLEDVTLEEALTAISREAGLRLMYSKAVVPLESRVRLQAKRITVAGALTEVLLDAGVDVLLTPNRQAVLTRRASAKPMPAVVQGGAVTGRVTDAKTEEGLVGAEVLLEGTKWRTGTDEGGRYRLADVTPGDYTLTVRRIGYAKRSQAVTVVSDQETTADLALQPVPTQLDEIVTTVTGEQRLRELGHVVGRINADSLVREAPISNLTELLNGRVPGLQVFTNSGNLGGSVQLQVRGASSVNLNNAPVVIVDGVRYTGVDNGAVPAGAFGAEPTTRLNDLNPNDIESIDIVKGPSAATLYGTDAANGVIVITTKQGRPGPARWNMYAKASRTEIPVSDFEDNYFAWGHRPSDPATPVSCPLVNAAGGSCVQDSVVTVPNPLNDPGLSIFKSQPRWEYGTSVAGGQEDLRYYISGDYERAIGPFQMPPAIETRLREQRGVSGLPEEQREPNAFTKGNLRANLMAKLAETAEVQLSAGYTQSATRTLAVLNPYNQGAGENNDPAAPYGPLTGPENLFSATSTERLNRFTGSVTGEWRPRAWLRGTARGGVDLINVVRASLIRAGEAPTSFWPTGQAGDDHSRQLTSTLDLGFTATGRTGRLSTRTSVGAQYVRGVSDALASTGTDLPPGGESVSQAASIATSQTYEETATLGGYVEQVVGLNDRLFLTGALRADGASTFGRDYEAVLYPKAGASWLLSDEPFLAGVPALDELRIRYAFGASGRQPAQYMGRTSFHYARRFLEDSAQVVAFVTLGNANLRPERVREHEFGFDAGFLQRRVTADLTWHRRTTFDGIMSVLLPPSVGGSIYTNVGRIQGHGFEARVTARVLDGRSLSWDVSLQHGTHVDEVRELGDAPPQYNPQGGVVAGYPLGGRFVQNIERFADANGNGIIEPSEVQLGDTVYVGHSTPPRTQTLASTVGLFGRRLRLSVLLERRSGFTQIDQSEVQKCGSVRCRAAVDPSTPLGDQARVIPLQVTSMYSLIEAGDFTRLREVTVAYELPSAVARVLQSRRATISVQGRNLALWSAFSGADPESVSPFGAMSPGAQNIPQARTWTLRLDLDL